MDVKGIAWVGHLYQKFETMCLEVEDIICQDTMKYVENQVETVGASVKRFYADVMQDLLPQSASNDEKVAVCNSTVDQYKNVVVCKKPVKSMKIERSKFSEEKPTENSKVIAKTKGDIIQKLSHRLPHADNPANGANIKGLSRKKFDENIHYKLDLDGGETTRKKSKNLSETSRTREYANDASSCSVILDRNCKDSCDHTGQMATTLFVKDTSDSTTQTSNKTGIEEAATDGGIDNLSSDVSSNSIENSEREMRLLSYGDSSAELNVADFLTIDGSVMVIESSPNEDVQLNHYPDGEISMFHLERSDTWCLDETEIDDIPEPGAKNIQQADAVKVDDACVMVNEDDFQLDSHQEAKCRPYKKKISRAFSFIKKSKRKQEYEALAVRHDLEFGTNLNQKHEEANLVPNLKMDEQKLQTEDVAEHDWQLL